MDELRPGTLIAGRYAVVRLLGTGASKQVYLADDKLTGALVALALLLGERSLDAMLAARFSREARAASVLRSPYVVRVFDVGKLADNTRYLVTEAVLGRGMADALAYGGVEPDEAARWTMHVLTALAEAHDRGILHRDVKPENVLLAPAPQGEVAKLTDFGLAKVLDMNLEGSVMLKTGQNTVLGTPDYMSPEQWQGLPLDVTTDIYATGVMLYELLTGKVPFGSKNLHEVCIGHLTKPVPAFPDRATAGMRALEPVVRRALEKKTRDRFPTALAMREAIARAVGYEVEAPEDVPGAALPIACVRAELLCDAWSGPVRVIATANVLLGRESIAHVQLKCLPPSDENSRRTQTISRQHAQLEWRGGRAHLVDLGSRGGTRVGERAVGPDPVALASGDTIAIGKHVTLHFEHAPAQPGELPRWARLTRTDAFGGGQVYVLVLTEAKLSSAPDAAIRVPAEAAAGDVLRLRVEAGALVVLPVGSSYAVPLQDGQTLRLGGLAISVGLDAMT